MSLQAAIASLQTAEPIDWPQVAELYRRLAEFTGSPVVELNRAVALAQAGDPTAALRRRRRPRPGRLPYFTPPAASCCGGSAVREEAREAYHRALELATSIPERRFLTKRLEQL